eukprot:SAG31_NODE_785_length_12089_cov_4.342936_1_plen_47_part_00
MVLNLVVELLEPTAKFCIKVSPYLEVRVPVLNLAKFSTGTSTYMYM